MANKKHSSPLTFRYILHFANSFLLKLGITHCEHLVDAVAALVGTLLDACPGLRVLATSQLPLGLDGEVVVAVRPEKIEAGTEPASPAANRLSGMLVAKSYLGDRNHYQVTIAGLGQPLMVATEQGDRSTLASFSPGEPVTVSWGDNSMVLLPKS